MKDQRCVFRVRSDSHTQSAQRERIKMGTSSNKKKHRYLLAGGVTTAVQEGVCKRATGKRAREELLRAACQLDGTDMRNGLDDSAQPLSVPSPDLHQSRECATSATALQSQKTRCTVTH